MICPNCNTDSGPSLFCYVCDTYLPSLSQGVKASIPSRLGAFLLDEFVLLAVLIVVGVIAYFAGVHIGASSEDYDPKTILTIICIAALSYFLLILWFLARGQTPGKWLVDIRAVDKRNGSAPGLGRMLLRETLGKWVSGCFLGLGWFWAIWDRDAQAWHDKIARTVVLYRRSRSRKYLPFLLVFGLPVLSVGFLWASLVTKTGSQRGGESIEMLPSPESMQSSQEAAAFRVPFVGCSSDGQSGPVPAPKGADRVVPMDAGTAGRLAYYKAAGLDVLAPRGWYCFETYGSDGSSLFVAPQPMERAWGGYTGATTVVPVTGGFTGPAIQVTEMSGETSGRFQVAHVLARIFPAERAFVETVIQEGADAAEFPFGPYPGDKLIFQNKRSVEYQTPPHSRGLGTDSSLQPNDYPIDGIAILQGQTPDVLVLNVRLPHDMGNLTSPIIHQFEQDHADRLSKQIGALNNERQSESALIRQAAEQGDAHAQTSLGGLYYLGHGVPQDYAQALYWYRKASKQGDAQAQGNLGGLYANGHGVRQDYTQAVYWYSKAAEQGDANAEYNLGILYDSGLGESQDFAQAATWFRRSADQGNALAQDHLGNLYFSGKGVPQDYTQAAYWCTKAAEQGDAHAQYDLGSLYYLGNGVPQDYAQAYFWTTLAASGKIEAVKQKDVDELRRDVATHLTQAELSQERERVREWLQEHPTRVD